MDNNENNMNNENLVEENTSAKETNGVDENGGYVSQFGELTNAEGEPLQTTVPVEEPKKKFFLFKYIHPSIFIAICVFFVLRQISMWIPFNSETHVGSLYDYIQNKIAWWHLYMSGYLG